MTERRQVACIRCGYEWMSRIVPKKCAGCGSPYWDRPRRDNGVGAKVVEESSKPKARSTVRQPNPEGDMSKPVARPSSDVMEQWIKQAKGSGPLGDIARTKLREIGEDWR